MKKLIYITVVLFTGMISACKKENKTVPIPPAPVQASTIDLIKDSVFLYAKEDYLWYDALPDYATFKPRSFTGSDDITALSNELDAISQFKINPTTGKPFEYYAPSPGSAKYSFVDDGSVAKELNGVHGDFGFAPKYNAQDRTDLRVKYVYPGSPADLAKIKRGYRITSINSRTDLAYDGDGAGTTVNYVVNAYSNSKTISMTLQRPDGSVLTVNNLTSVDYTVNPVLRDTVFDQGNGHKVGYIVFNTFTSDANADPKLDAVFNDFTQKGVTDLVVDLRYNGGGYVSTAEHLDNLIVPAAASGSVMYTAYFNNKLQNDQYPLLSKQFNINAGDFKPQNNQVAFAKKGALSINQAFFIVTGSTASASELTINNLRSHMNVQLIGTTSYGKPVGFFPISINKYQIYIPEFETKNSATQGGYYAGMTPGSTDFPGKLDYDDVTHDFGDPSEGLLAHALHYVTNNTYSFSSPKLQSLSGVKIMSVQQANTAGVQLDGHKFSGMIFNNKLKSKK